MADRAVATVEAAKAVAEWLETNGQHKRAAEVRKVCVQNSAYRETCRRLHADNLTLRGHVTEPPHG